MSTPNKTVYATTAGGTWSNSLTLCAERRAIAAAKRQLKQGGEECDRVGRIPRHWHHDR